MLTIWQHLTQLSFVRTKMYRPIKSDFETRDTVTTPTANTHTYICTTPVCYPLLLTKAARCRPTPEKTI